MCSIHTSDERRTMVTFENHPSQPRAFNGVLFIRCVPSTLQMSVEPWHYSKTTLPDHEHSDVIWLFGALLLRCYYLRCESNHRNIRFRRSIRCFSSCKP